MKKEKTMIVCSIIFIMVFFVGVFSDAVKDSEWEKALNKERLDKDVIFKKFPDSPMARTKRLVIPAAQVETFVLKTNDDVILSDKNKAGIQLSIVNKGGEWTWYKHNPGISYIAGDKTINPGSPMTANSFFKLGRFILMAYPASDRLLLIVYDPERPQFKQFSHLFYFSPDQKYVVKAVFEKFPLVESLKINTSQKEERNYYRYARLKFQLDGKEFQLTALKFNLDPQTPEAAMLFVPFSDATSGKETYEVGRFLDIHEPTGNENEVILDFNRCYNPLCNYSPGFNCPIPPLENYLDIEIKAGEKIYPHS